jgi:hypothetical protein
MQRASLHAALQTAAIGLLLFPALAHAGLKWDSTLVREEALAGQDVVNAEFRFQNDGDKDATIDSVRATCGCTTASVAKMRYAPGEVGTVAVVFTVGDRSGYQRKTVEVREQGAKAPIVLTLAVHLAEPVKVSPAELKWKKGETSAKTVEVSALPGVRIEKVETTAPEFEVQSKEASPGTWAIAVRPQAADKPVSALLRVTFSGRAAGVISVPVAIE